MNITKMAWQLATERSFTPFRMTTGSKAPHLSWVLAITPDWNVLPVEFREHMAPRSVYSDSSKIFWIRTKHAVIDR
jgi:hypothetical protein